MECDEVDSGCIIFVSGSRSWGYRGARGENRIAPCVWFVMYVHTCVVDGVEGS